MLPESVLESIALNFKSSLNPLTGKAMDINITEKDFVEIKD